MKYILWPAAVLLGISFAPAEEKPSINHQHMEHQTNTIRLIYPQWQGGVVSHWMPDLPAEDASRGYYLGARLLRMLAPESSQKTVEVPVSLDIGERKVEKGISDRSAILAQTKAALEKLRENNPDKIVTLGGECSVSVVPFTYLAEKYPDDVAVVWIDAHPDINLPGDEYKGYHAMALAACMGMGDEEIMKLLPGKVDASKVLIAGLRAWEKDGGTKERQKSLNIKSLSPAELAGSSDAVLNWLEERGVSRVLIHFDLDVLDPAEIIAGVGVEPGGMKISEVVRVINDIAARYDVAGLTVAEPMPRLAIKIKNMLNQLPLLKQDAPPSPAGQGTGA
ncbi:arginase [Akkermansia muciniphila]|nr:arginase [Akkermansia muciniphila]PNC37156.1 arginase [Akkermansia muciniphila]